MGRRMPNGHWEDFANVEAALRPVVAELGRMPMSWELSERRMTSIGSAIVQLHGGYRAVEKRMALKPAAKRNRPKKQVPDGHWKTFANVEAVLVPIVAELGRMPTQNELGRRKLSSVACAIHAHHGGWNAVADALGIARIAQRKPPGFWREIGNVEEILRPIVVELGRMPNSKEFAERDLESLYVAIVGYHGGVGEMERRLGLGATARKKCHGHWEDFSNVRAALEPVVAELGRMPKQKELTDRGLHSLSHAISKHHGGVSAVERRLGIANDSKRKPPKFWKDYGNVERAVLELAVTLGRMPTSIELGEHGLAGAVRAIDRYFGRFPAFRVRLGFGPVTDEAIASHADALAAIVPAIGANSTAIWTRMKRSWTKRDLDAAIATHATSGSIEAFERLLGD